MKKFASRKYDNLPEIKKRRIKELEKKKKQEEEQRRKNNLKKLD